MSLFGTISTEGTRDRGENKEMRCKQRGVQIGNKGEWDNGKRTMRWKPCPDGRRNGNRRRKLGDDGSWGDDGSCAGSAGSEWFVTWTIIHERRWKFV